MTSTVSGHREPEARINRRSELRGPWPLTPSVGPWKESAMSGKPQRLTLVQQNDTHAHVEPHWEHYWRGGKPEYRRTGGLARAAAIVRTIREETGNACLFADCGDSIHGTGPAQWTQGAAIVPVLNAMGIEAMTPGNWEYGFGPEVLRQRAGELRFPLLAANVEWADSGDLLFPATLLRDVGGLQVGLSRSHFIHRQPDAASIRSWPSLLGRPC